MSPVVNALLIVSLSVVFLHDLLYLVFGSFYAGDMFNVLAFAVFCLFI